jgi:hypothetical protein
MWHQQNMGTRVPVWGRQKIGSDYLWLAPARDPVEIRSMGEGVTRRTLLERAALGAGALALPAGLLRTPARATSPNGVVPLPSAAALRADIQRMVDFGPRLTGSDAHNAYIDWLEREFAAAGCRLLPRDDKELVCWEAKSYGLEVGGKPVKVAAYEPRSQETGPKGVSGPLALPGAVTAGSIPVVDLPLPAPLTEGIFLGLTTETHWSGHTTADYVGRDYRRLWIVEGAETAPYKELGAAGVVFVLDASYEALLGDYAPFLDDFQNLPALYVDRDTGAELRAAAATQTPAKLTLDATRRKVKSPSIVAVLPGESDEALILNTHTDGQNFVEENGGVGLVHLARHYASTKKLGRTLVFSLVTGHMAPNMPQTQGFIDDHPDLVACAAAAITIEHLGCQEWVDDKSAGYRYTGDPEVFGIWTTQGRMKDVTSAAVKDYDIPHCALLRGPPQFGIGGAFQTSGVPQIGALAGPNYLVSVVDDGHMDKLDADLAARQLRWVAGLLERLDPIPAAELASGDPSLGSKPAGKCSHTAAVPKGSLRVSLEKPGRKSLNGRVAFNRPGDIELVATVAGKQISGAVIRLEGAGGKTSFSLPLKKPLPKRARVKLTARASAGGRTYTRVVRR